MTSSVRKVMCLPRSKEIVPERQGAKRQNATRPGEAGARLATGAANADAQNPSGSVNRVQRPPFTTARNDELAPWCLFGPKFASGPLKMSR